MSDQSGHNPTDCSQLYCGQYEIDREKMPGEVHQQDPEQQGNDHLSSSVEKRVAAGNFYDQKRHEADDQNPSIRSGCVKCNTMWPGADKTIPPAANPKISYDKRLSTRPSVIESSIIGVKTREFEILCNFSSHATHISYRKDG